MLTRRLAHFFLFALATAALASCADDGGAPVRLPTPQSGVPFAATEDQLLQNFRTVYQDLDVAAYIEMIHPDYATFLQLQTRDEFPSVGPTLDRAEEMRIASRMFGGQLLSDPDGRLVPGISAITFATFERQEEWTDSLPNDPLPNTWSARYAVGILLDRPGFSTLRVEGQIKFYVASRDSLHDGALQPYWEMLGQQDLTISGLKSIEETAWGSLKALFR